MSARVGECCVWCVVVRKKERECVCVWVGGRVMRCRYEIWCVCVLLFCSCEYDDENMCVLRSSIYWHVVVVVVME